MDEDLLKALKDNTDLFHYVAEWHEDDVIEELQRFLNALGAAGYAVVRNYA